MKKILIILLLIVTFFINGCKIEQCPENFNLQQYFNQNPTPPCYCGENIVGKCPITAQCFIPKQYCCDRELSKVPCINMQWNEKIGLRLDIVAPYSATEIHIYGNGDIYYEANALGLGIEQETDSSKISQENLHELINTIESNNFFSLEDSYPFKEDYPADVYSYSIAVKIDNQEKIVSCYEFACPKEFKNVKNKIEELWSKYILEVGTK